jgi:hypothetical protein
MNQKLTLISAGVLVLGTINHVYAQYTPPTMGPFQGFINEYLRAQNPPLNQWDIGGSERLRSENKQGFAIQGIAGSVDFLAHGVKVDNNYLLNRLRLHVGYTEDWWSAFAEGQSSLAYNDARFAYANFPPVAGTVKRKENGPEADAIDLHQAYFTAGNSKEFPLTLKAGRQEMIYGEERLIGAFGWNNIGRAFDAVKLRWQNALFSADFFSGYPVIPENGEFDVDNSHDWFSGVYATSTKIPKTILEAYFLARNASREAINTEPSPQFPQPTARDIYTVGGRLKSAPGALGRWDYTLEGAYQFGDFATNAVAPRLTQDAFMAVAQAGYTFSDTPTTPRLGAEYAYGSGSSGNGRHGTFDNLFPTNHKFYGYMDFVSLQNIQDVRGELTLKPSQITSFAIEGHGFWLADTHDYFYNVAGQPRTTGGYGIHPGYNSFVGSELDVIGSLAVTRNAQFEVGYGHFFPGEYIKQSLAGVGGEQAADYVYVQTTINF